MEKLTAAEYLRKRGWTMTEIPESKRLGVEAGESWSHGHMGSCYTQQEAIEAQLAIDEDREMGAWRDGFKAAPMLLGGGVEIQCGDWMGLSVDERVGDCAHVADLALAAYRARFAVEIVDEPAPEKAR